MMAIPRDERYPASANPEQFLTGAETGDREDIRYGEGELLDDLFELGLWDEIDAWADSDED